jgi:hypothetical protein
VYGDDDKMKMVHLQDLCHQYEMVQMSYQESVEELFRKLVMLKNQMKSFEETTSDTTKIVNK